MRWCSFPTGNSNLVYAIIRKRSVFHQLANLPTDPPAIHKALQRRRKAPEPLSRTSSQEGASMEGSRPAAPAEPGTLKTSLVATPGLALAGGGGCGHRHGWGLDRVFGVCHPISGKGHGKLNRWGWQLRRQGGGWGAEMLESRGALAQWGMDLTPGCGLWEGCGHGWVHWEIRHRGSKVGGKREPRGEGVGPGGDAAGRALGRGPHAHLAPQALTS